MPEIDETWNFTVWSLIRSRTAIALFGSPSASSPGTGTPEAKKALGREQEGRPVWWAGPGLAGGKGRLVYGTGDMEHGGWSAGTVMGIINDVPSCKELVERIVNEAEEMIRGRLAKAIAA